MASQIPEVVILRLPLYARTLAALRDSGQEVISSHELGGKLHITPAQIRKDLSYFGKFGKQGRGYNIKRLLEELQQILGLNREWSMALVGVGRLGRAIIGYGGFAPQGFRVVAAFDTSPELVGTQVEHLIVQDIAELGATIKEKSVNIGIVAVPASHAQEVINVLVSSGVKAILNYAPVVVKVPEDVRVREIDPVLALQSMTYYIKKAKERPAEAATRSRQKRAALSS